MKNLSLIFLILLCSLVSKAQTDSTVYAEFSREIYSLKQKSNGHFRTDSSLKQVLHVLQEKKADITTIDKDSLRSLLQKEGNHDYNVELIAIEYSNIKNLENFRENYDNTKLPEVLADTLYNTIAFVVEKKGRKKMAYILATQNYIEFDSDVTARCNIDLYGRNDEILKPYELVYTGTSKTKGISCTTYSGKGNAKKEIKANEKINVDENGKFKLVIDVAGKKGPVPDFFDIIDGNDRIVAQYKIQ